MARTRRSAKTTTRRPTAPKAAPAGADGPTQLRGELQQLATIRARFPALAPEIAAALLAHHGDDACRKRGDNTRGVDVFRAGMNWARTLGDHADDPAVSPRRARWFIDCLTALGHAMADGASSANPALVSAYDDAARKADRLIARTTRRARDAAGTNAAWHDALDHALSHDGVEDPRGAKLRALSATIKGWASADGGALPGVYDLDEAACDALLATADALDQATARRPSPTQIGVHRDSPAVNIAEGRLLLAMRPLWDDLAEAREDGITRLQFTVSPALLRGLNLYVRKTPAQPAPEG